MIFSDTLYVVSKVDIGWWVPRKATHDELIAAMPRCGTCDRWKKQGRVFEDGDFVNVGLCSRYDMIPREDYGCTDHIPISNQSTE